MEVRIKGSAMPKGSRWGWKINIFMLGSKEFTINSAKDELYNKREEAVAALQEHGKEIQKLISEKTEGPIDFSKLSKPVKKEKFNRKSKMSYEFLMNEVYTKAFWERVRNYARYDFKFRHIENKVMEEKPDPNVILITGMRNKESIPAEPEEAPELLDLPFGTCVIESTDGTLFNLDSADLAAGSDDVESIFVTEMEGHYGFIALLCDGNMTWAADPKTDTYKVFMIVLKDLCRFINSKDTRVGQQKINARFKHKKTGLCKIKKAIHIARKARPGELKEVLNSFPVDWSHRWEVRGHWRKFDGTGKNRNGERKIKGHTWVKSHTKGPDEEDLVKKVRVIK